MSDFERVFEGSDKSEGYFFSNGKKHQINLI